MRYRLMASYRGTPYQAGVGPSDSEVTLLAAWPPPEEHGFVSSGSHWRKQVRIDDVEALWESRPVGSYHGDPCLVLDDLGDRLHIAYLGMDSTRASQLGYWQVDRGVFEVVIPRTEVADLAEERHEFSLTALMFTPDPPASRMLAPAPPALDRAYPALERPAPPMDRPAPGLPALERPMPAAERPAPARQMPALERPLPPAPAPERPQPAAERPLPPFERPAPPAEYPMPAPERSLPRAERPPPAGATAWHGSPAEEDGAWPGYPRPDDPGSLNGNGSAAHNGTGGFKALGWADPFPEPAGFPDRAATPTDLRSPQAAEPLAPLSAPLPAEPQVAEPQVTGPQVTGPQVTGPPADRSGAPEMVRGRRAARKPRVSTQSVFAELLDLAQIPRSSYAVDEEVSGAMCLTKITGGFEVFSCTDDARHEVRFFEDEEAAYFYLFGVLAADAVRSGSLTPRSSLSILLNTQSEATSHDISENLREYVRYTISLARDA